MYTASMYLLDRFGVYGATRARGHHGGGRVCTHEGGCGPANHNPGGHGKCWKCWKCRKYR